MTTPFFVPGQPPSEEEVAYTQLAEFCGYPALPAGKRIYSITFRHNGEEWTATVGKCLSGIRRKKAARGKPASVVQLGDPALVLAIFPGASCYRVVTDSGKGRSQWVNPFLAGVPDFVTLFA